MAVDGGACEEVEGEVVCFLGVRPYTWHESFFFAITLWSTFAGFADY